ncbi:MAG TPA: MbcA/ParS/Xre antitoxin family protein [Bryobacteraceae bacterium]|nr:MbcA/ParS/Xre antitoxin family protein [Bryobacteraceae bacterium]
MELPARRAKAIPQIASIPPERRRDPKIRRQMSGPAIRAFFNIAEVWQLSGEDQQALLGWPAESTFYKYKAGQVGTLSYDMLMRISLILGIFKDLRILYPERDLADRWVHLPNSNPLFGGAPALALMTGGGLDGLYQVRRLLDARRGGWS